MSGKEYNIILLGETGTGKSLFINYFANYFQFDTLKEAIESEERVNLITSTFKVTDFNEEDHEIISGENDDGNEKTEVGESFTIGCKSYKFQIGEVSVRLIDTPGVGDTEGEEADIINVANILNYINNFDNLHAIGIVMNNTQTKMTDRFTKCLKTLLTNLNKSAVDNIVFLLTFSKANDFKPGPVKALLQTFIKNDLAGRSLKAGKDRMYCLDNKSYEYMVATQKRVQFDEDDFDSQNFNWKKSSNEVSRLISYVSRLTPHRVRDTVSLNDARQFIKIIHPFLSNLLKNIDKNTKLIAKFERDWQKLDENAKIIERDKNLKQTDIKIVAIETAITFCTSPKCREKIEIGGKEEYHYPKQCCQGCIVNNNWRWLCEAPPSYPLGTIGTVPKAYDLMTP